MKRKIVKKKKMYKYDVGSCSNCEGVVLFLHVTDKKTKNSDIAVNKALKDLKLHDRLTHLEYEDYDSHL